ncbi:TcaA second domain-containing protein [Caloramator sp. E03]|uniref:TcaA second domain-containing protein n=1 Tax=Caloramator sp. E03 TaxID=2576307 RepID=UPI00352B2730
MKNLVKYLYVSDKNLKLDDKSVEPLTKYLKDNSFYTKDLIENLTKQAYLLCTNSALYNIAQNNSFGY